MRQYLRVCIFDVTSQLDSDIEKILFYLVYKHFFALLEHAGVIISFIIYIYIYLI